MIHLKRFGERPQRQTPEQWAALAESVIDSYAKKLEQAKRERDEAREIARAALADAARQADRAQEAEAGWASARRTNCDYNRTIAEIERELDEARRDRDAECVEGKQWRARYEQATALLREALRVVDVVADGHTFDQMEAADIAVRIRAGQPAPAKVAVDDAMVERACRMKYGAEWWDSHIPNYEEDIRRHREAMRAVLVTALEGRG